MRFVKLAEQKWSILIHSKLNTSGMESCQTLEFLTCKKHRKLAKKMKAMLSGYVPINGPPKHNKNKARYLRDGIYEFKAGPRLGAEIRTLFFYGGSGNIVICSETFKKAEITDDEAIDRASKLKEEYEQIKKSDMTIIDLSETEYQDDYEKL